MSFSSDFSAIEGAAVAGEGARAFSRSHPVWLCDIWGVVHDGVRAYRPACHALERHRASGGCVVLITNAPRPSRVIVPQLDRLGVSRDAYDAVVSSGDVTIKLMASRRDKVLHIGPERDLGLCEDAAIEFAGPDEARHVLCTGLIDDETETPEDYEALLRRLNERGLDMICANPDKVVRRGNELIPCAGALAELYEGMGGKVLMAGKPFAPIYEAALDAASNALGRPVRRGEVLAIGDGLETDVEGAARNDIDLLFIVGGIHEAELGNSGPEAYAEVVRKAVPDARLKGVLKALHW
jgi:HAD superfamily hydrolase (TIGR01459 family)